MKTLHLLRGVSGAGKTTLAQTLAEGLYMCYELCADYYFCEPEGSYTYNTDTYCFDHSKLNLAHQWCLETVEGFMRDNKACENVIVHNTFTTEKEMKPYEDLAEKYGFRVVRMVVENTHGNKDVHGVPQEIRDRQERRLRDSLRLQ